MATIPQSHLRIDDEGNYVIQDKDYAGYTVDVLLEQGKVEEARAEFERLILEGVDSGPGIEVTPQFWEDIRAELKPRGRTPTMSQAPVKLKITQKAKRDLSARARYLQKEGSLLAAEHLLLAVASTMDLLRITRGMGKTFRLQSRGNAEFRWIPVSGSFRRWLLVYTFNGTEVRIERITHSAQDIRIFLP